MMPAQPPLPTAWNFRFQPEAGSHTSTLMSESVEGFKVAVTRQKAGRSFRGFADAGGVKAPGATDEAMVMVVSGNDSDARFSQVVAAIAHVAKRMESGAKKLSRI